MPFSKVYIGNSFISKEVGLLGPEYNNELVQLVQAVKDRVAGSPKLNAESLAEIARDEFRKRRTESKSLLATELAEATFQWLTSFLVRVTELRLKRSKL